MSWIISILLSSLAYSAVQPSPSPIDIRVRIAEAVPSVVVRGFDLRIYETQKWGLKLVASVDKVSEWELRCQDGNIRIMLLNSNSSKRVLELQEPVSIQTPVGFISYGGQPYRDELRVYSSGLLCDVIDDVDLEKYLDGLVNSEFSSKWNEESIAAQVVAARTYAYYQIREARAKKRSHFDVDATVKDQVYNGSMREDFHASRVVERTRGIILTTGPDQNPVPIKAFYHSTCGGTTVLPEHVWATSYPGFKRAIVCPYCTGSPRYHWSLDLAASEISQFILRGVMNDGLVKEWPKNALDLIRHGRLMDIRTLRPNEEKRNSQVVTVWADESNAIDLPISAVSFRQWLGGDRLRSTAFQVTFRKIRGASAWHFEGQGSGHGVGMCQWGAKTMGDNGHDMYSILKFYYPDAIIRKLW